MKLRAINPFAIFGAILIAQVAAQCSASGTSPLGNYGPLLVNGQLAANLTYTGFPNASPQIVNISQYGNSSINGVTISSTNCTGVANVNFAAFTPPATVKITPIATGTCTFAAQSSLSGTAVPINVTILSTGPTSSPAPSPGPLSFSPASLSFSSATAPAKSVVMSDPNNDTPVTPIGGGLTCASGGITIWTMNDNFNGASSTRNMSPNATGSCTLTYSDGYGNSATLTGAVATTTPSPTAAPTATPTPSGTLTVAIRGNWGGNAYQGGVANGGLTITHNSGDATWLPSEVLVAKFSSSLTAAQVSVPSPLPSPGSTPVPGLFSFSITGTPPPGNTTSPAVEDSGTCYGTNPQKCTGDGHLYGGTHWITTLPYSTGSGAYNIAFSHTTPCETYTITINGPQATPYSAQFEYNSVGATPCPGSTATPVPMPTPCVAPGSWSTYIATAVSTPSPANPCPAAATSHVQDYATYLAHPDNTSLADESCSGTVPSVTCTLNPGSVQQLQWAENAGMGAPKMEFDTNVLWSGAAGFSGSAASFTNPNFAPFDAIYTAALSYGQTIVPALDQYGMSAPYTFGSTTPATRTEVFSQFCSQVAAHAASTWSHVDEIDMYNEPNTGQWAKFPLQAYVVGGGQQGGSSVTVQLQNGTSIPNSGSAPYPSKFVPDGTRIGFADGANYTLSETISTTGSTVQALGNGQYLITLPAGITFAHSHAINSPVALNSDTSGYTAGLYALGCYSAIKAAAPSIRVVGPEGTAKWPPNNLAQMMSVGCHTGTCWDIYSGHLQNWYCMCAPSNVNGEGAWGDWKNWYSATTVLNANNDPASLAGTLRFKNDEWGYSKSIFYGGQGFDLQYQAWLYAQSLNAMWSGGLTVGWSYQGASCWRCAPTSFGGNASGYCGPPGLTAAQGSNWGWGAVTGSNVYYGQYGGTDLVEHGAADTGCNTGDGSVIGQAASPALATVKQFNCAFAPAASCTGSVLTDSGERERAIAMREMIAYEKRGNVLLAARIADTLLQSTGLRIAWNTAPSP